MHLYGKPIKRFKMADNKNSYKVKANGFEFFFTQEEIEAADVVKKSATEFNLLKNHRSVNVRMVSADIVTKKFTVEVEGENFNIEIKDELDLVLEKMGFGTASHKQIKEIKAPMPGLVLDITVTEGQEVNQGDTILILQAMKMENSITVHDQATIKRIAVAPGQPVEKGQLLVELM
jgi:biotin carboxyl carrier protein